MNCQSGPASNKTDEELVALSIKDQFFFAELVRRYEYKLARYIHRISNFEHEEIQDLLQEIFIKAYINLNGFDPKLKFSSWIYRIAHNQTISIFRKNSARPRSINSSANDYILDNMPAEFDAAAKIDQDFLRKNIDDILAELDPKYRAVLVLKYFESQTYDEIADILKKPPGTIATLLNRAKKQFRKILEKKRGNKIEFEAVEE